MQCINGQTIKEERDCEHDVRTVVIDDSQKIILSPRVEIHRVLKAPPDELDHPQQIIYTTTNTRSVVPHHIQQGSGVSGHNIENQPIQRVQVIKDGRFYEEPTPPPQLSSSASTVVRTSYTNQKGNGVVYQSSPPPLLHHSHHHQQQHHSETKKIILSRQINVISNGVDNRDINGGTTVTPVQQQHQTLVGGALQQQQQPPSTNGIFRPPVVSSTSTPMRPPPPPPPPRIKGASPEEPSSSIPDLGK